MTNPLTQSCKRLLQRCTAEIARNFLQSCLDHSNSEVADCRFKRAQLTAAIKELKKWPTLVSPFLLCVSSSAELRALLPGAMWLELLALLPASTERRDFGA